MCGIADTISQLVKHRELKRTSVERLPTVAISVDGGGRRTRTLYTGFSSIAVADTCECRLRCLPDLQGYWGRAVKPTMISAPTIMVAPGTSLPVGR